jgi:hypothetical protein
MGTLTKDEQREIKSIRSKMRSSGGYGDMVEGVHTWNADEIFEDMRALLRIVKRLTTTQKGEKVK